MKKISGVMIDFESKVSQLAQEKKTEPISNESPEKSTKGDELIVKKIETEELNFEEMANLISQINNEDIKEEQIKRLLEILYNFDTDTSRFIALQQENTPNDMEIMTIIKSATKLMLRQSKEIEEIVIRITAKQLAIDYKRFGTILLTTFKECINCIKMLEIDMPSLIIGELGKLYPEVKLEPGFIKKQILLELAGDIATACNESENNVIELPQSRSLQKLTEEERDLFIKEITSKLNKDIDIEATKADIIAQINKPIEDNIFFLDSINETTQKMADTDSLEVLKLFNVIATDVSKEPKLISALQELYHAVSIIPEDNKQKAMEIFTNTINERFSTKEPTGTE